MTRDESGYTFSLSGTFGLEGTAAAQQAEVCPKDCADQMYLVYTRKGREKERALGWNKEFSVLPYSEKKDIYGKMTMQHNQEVTQGMT